jgi:hypothetical protein
VQQGRPADGDEHVPKQTFSFCFDALLMLDLVRDASLEFYDERCKREGVNWCRSEVSTLLYQRRVFGFEYNNYDS